MSGRPRPRKFRGGRRGCGHHGTTGAWVPLAYTWAEAYIWADRPFRPEVAETALSGVRRAGHKLQDIPALMRIVGAEPGIIASALAPGSVARMGGSWEGS